MSGQENISPTFLGKCFALAIWLFLLVLIVECLLRFYPKLIPFNTVAHNFYTSADFNAYLLDPEFLELKDVKIVAIGDSITLGIEAPRGKRWTELLGKAVGGHVANFGYGGFSTLNSLIHLTSFRKEMNIDAVIHTIYENDIWGIEEELNKADSGTENYVLNLLNKLRLDAQKMFLPCYRDSQRYKSDCFYKYSFAYTAIENILRYLYGSEKKYYLSSSLAEKPIDHHIFEEVSGTWVWKAIDGHKNENLEKYKNKDRFLRRYEKGIDLVVMFSLEIKKFLENKGVKYYVSYIPSRNEIYASEIATLFKDKLDQEFFIGDIFLSKFPSDVLYSDFTKIFLEKKLKEQIYIPWDPFVSPSGARWPHLGQTGHEMISNFWSQNLKKD